VEREVMSGVLVIFFVLAGMAVLGAVSLIVQSHPIHSALSLILVMVSLAGLYLLMGAEFIAAVQIIVYGGAVMVLFIFVIMLLNAGAEARRGRSYTVQILGVPLLIALLGLLAFLVERLFPQTISVHFGGFTGGTAKAVGQALFTTYLLPFEVTSLLILIAIIGAIVLARKEMD
jgi:NADH-quinone oxidoreductase subunit J